MDFVEIPLNSFRYRFRRLTWKEEAALKLPAGVDQREIVLSHALVNVSGLAITSTEDTLKVLRQVPPALRWRIWIVYRGNLPADEYYQVRGLYEAPDYKTHQKRLTLEGMTRKSTPSQQGIW